MKPVIAKAYTPTPEEIAKTYQQTFPPGYVPRDEMPIVLADSSTDRRPAKSAVSDLTPEQAEKARSSANKRKSNTSHLVRARQSAGAKT